MNPLLVGPLVADAGTDHDLPACASFDGQLQRLVELKFRTRLLRQKDLRSLDREIYDFTCDLSLIPDLELAAQGGRRPD